VLEVDALPADAVALLAAFVADVAAADSDAAAADSEAAAAAADAEALAACVVAALAASCASTPAPRTITLERPATDGAGGATTNVSVVPLIVKSWAGICATPATNTCAALLPV
jgi:hypothetical protein